MIYYWLFNNSITAQQAVALFLISVFVYIISITLHEFAHAFVALKMGDDTPKLAGRVSLNPIKHLDMMGFISFMFLGIGWAKPVPINPLKFKKYRKGTRAVSIAGIATNILIGFLAAGIHLLLLNTVGIPSMAMEYVYVTLQYFMLINSFLAMFNLLPIYPMDGFNFITTFMKTENKFIQFSLRNSFKIMLTIVVVCLATNLMFGFDLLDWYLQILYNFAYMPIAWLGVL